MLFVVECHAAGVQLKEVPDLVRHISAHELTSTVSQPDLEQALSASEWQGGPDHLWLLELLA